MPNVWPSTLPKVPLRDGNREGVGEGRIFSAMDAGPAKVRRRTTATVKPFSFPMLVTGSQLTDFLTFWNTTLLGGSLTFEFAHPRTGSTVTARFGAEAPTWVQVDVDRYELALSVEVLP